MRVTVLFEGEQVGEDDVLYCASWSLEVGEAKTLKVFFPREMNERSRKVKRGKSNRIERNSNPDLFAADLKSQKYHPPRHKPCPLHLYWNLHSQFTFVLHALQIHNCTLARAFMHVQGCLCHLRRFEEHHQHLDPSKRIAGG